MGRPRHDIEHVTLPNASEGHAAFDHASAFMLHVAVYDVLP